MKYKDMTDKELMIAFQMAIEMQDGRTIKAIKDEMSRRTREE